MDMDEAPIQGEEPPNLRFLRILVTVLTGTMIAGLLVIIALLVIRFSGEGHVAALPDEIALPDGSTATAFTQGAGWYAVVTADQRILIFDAESGALRQEIAITAGE
ncbi:MAG: DUF6476 family protein [Pseudomonadota bacterium]|nr:DUF6476 family protein [Pseudomonadota bacterium]